MIVHNTNEGWEIIHQQAHGLLAFQIATQWQTAKRPIHWLETLTALFEHDDGQEAWENRNHLTDAGAPLHFTLKEYSVKQCRQLIDIALRKSRWNALMASCHTTFLYEQKRGHDPALDTFLDQQESNQTKWRRDYGATKAQVMYAYDLLQWCDALSLILCLDQVPAEARRLEISKDPDGVSQYIYQNPADQTLVVDPWPFETTTFRIHVELYSVDQLSFKNDKELYNAINNAPVTIREWCFKKA